MIVSQKNEEMICITLKEYKELLITKGKYEGIKESHFKDYDIPIEKIEMPKDIDLSTKTYYND
jgi:hypothetical protein